MFLSFDAVANKHDAESTSRSYTDPLCTSGYSSTAPLDEVRGYRHTPRLLLPTSRERPGEGAGAGAGATDPRLSLLEVDSRPRSLEEAEPVSFDE
jgi:hypothetical protein